MEQQRAKDEKERVKEQRDFEQQREENERTERAKEREVRRELQLAEEETKRTQLMLESERIKAQPSQERKSHNGDDFLVRMPRIPMYDEKIDCLESFLHRFELQARGYGWPESKWSTALINCLSGEPLKVFYTLSAGEADDYKKIKQALLKRFRLTEDGYQERFQKVKPEKDEDFSSFMNRTTQFFSRWTELAQVRHGDYEALQYLILKNQIYQACNPDLVAFFKERQPQNPDEMKVYADHYSSAHPAKPIGRILSPEPYYSSVAYSNNRKYEETDVNTQSRGSSWNQNRSNQDTRFRDASRQDTRYRDSSRPSHHQQGSQQQRFQNTASQNSDSKFYKERNYDQKKSEIITCQVCGRKGHGGNTCYKVVGYPKETANAAIHISQLSANSAINSDKIVYCVQGMSLLSQTAKSGSLAICRGKVNGIECSTLRDTGCTTVGVRESLVKERDRTGRKIKCATFSGSVETFETADIHIESPYFTGRVQGCILPNPTADLIIGNIAGIINDPPNIET